MTAKLNWTLNQYQDLAGRTICPQDKALDRIEETPRANGVMLLHALVGLTAEVGELATAVEHYVWYREDFDRANVIEEAGDILWRLAEVCTALGVSLQEVSKSNIAKLEEKFPEKFNFSRTKEVNRNRAAEMKALMNEIESDPTAPNYEKDNHA